MGKNAYGESADVSFASFAEGEEEEKRRVASTATFDVRLGRLECGEVANGVKAGRDALDALTRFLAMEVMVEVRRRKYN